jgi:transcriptional regulator with XRE-family HTH domain
VNDQGLQAALPAQQSFGARLHQWRRHRGLTQLSLSLRAEVSTRHLSWLETGRAEPSRAMVLRLAEQLELPLRERNAWLTAAGYAPLYRERALDDAALAPARALLQRLLQAHEPAPALAVDRHWQLVAHNRMVEPLLRAAAPELLQPPVNVLRLSLHPRGLAPLIENLPAWRAHVLQRLQRQATATGDPVLAALRDELQALPAPAAGGNSTDEVSGVDGTGHTDAPAAGALSDLAVPLTLTGPWGRLNFITTVTVFGAPHDVTLSEIAIETLLPADAGTAQALAALRASLDG